MGKTTNQRVIRWTGYIIAIYYLVGLIGLVLPQTRAFFISIIPLTILGSTILLLLFHRRWRSNDAVVLFFIALTGYLIEVLGVATGHIFGSYTYGGALGFQVLNTPLIIGVNWMMLVYCTYALMENTSLFWPLKALTASALMVTYDFVMEPVAIRLDMWRWAGNDIPLQNYQAWFIISMVFLAAMHLAKVRTFNRIAPWIFGVQFLFFLALNILLRVF